MMSGAGPRRYRFCPSRLRWLWLLKKGVTALGLKSGVKNNHGELLWQVTSRSESGFLPSVLLPAVHPLGMDVRG